MKNPHAPRKPKAVTATATRDAAEKPAVSGRVRGKVVEKLEEVGGSMAVSTSAWGAAFIRPRECTGGGSETRGGGSRFAGVWSLQSSGVSAARLVETMRVASTGALVSV